MKLKKCLILVLALSLLLTAACMFTATAEGEVVEETTTSDMNLKIYAKNLSLENAIYISYAVPVAGTESADSVKLLIWMTPQSEYTYGTQTYELSPEGTTTIGSAQYYVFVFDKLAAKRMAVDIYAKVYATDGENEYYSNLDKYSILQYAYNKLGKTSSNEPSPEMANLLNGMLDYGAYAQEYFGFNTDRLANDDYYQIKVENALFSDGAPHGLYRPDTQLIVTAPEENANGEDFLYWQNGAGDQLSESLSYTITVGEVNETYTAVYGKKAPAATDDSYFTFTDLSSVTCSIAAKDVNNMPAEVVIPSTYNGKTVTMIAPRAFFGCSSLTSIVIPDSVTGIGDSAFYGCAALSSAPLPNTLTSIGDRAFEGCVKLANIVIPNGVTSIGEYAFLDCHSFTEITVPSSVTSLSHAVFYYCVGLTKVTLPNTITSIESFAFANCYELTDITIPSSVVSIGDSAFLSCTSLASVVIPDSVTSLGGSAFSGCEGLISVTLPNSLTQLNSGVFENCSNMTDIVIPNSIKTIYGDAFEGTALEAVYYCGTAIKWQNMTIYSWNPVILNAPRYYYSETLPTDTTDRYWHYVDGVPTIWEIHIHTEVIDAAVAPTCTETGLTEGKHCSACGEILVAQETVDALGHTEIVIPEVPPQVGKTGLTEGVYCSICKVILKQQEEIPMLYSLTLVTNSDSYGSAFADAYAFFANDSVTVVATPKDGYQFVGWFEDGMIVSTRAEYTFTMPERNLVLLARFVDNATNIWTGGMSLGFAGGSGTEKDPYLIATGSQLAYLADEINNNPNNTLYNKYYKLISSIDLCGREWTPIGTGYSKTGTSYAATATFQGHFDGNGYRIDDFKITKLQNSAYSAIGLFGRVSGTIEHLSMEAFVIDLSLQKTVDVGSLVGYLSNGEITGCCVNGKINLFTDGSGDVGGLVGEVWYGTILNCGVVANINDTGNNSSAGSNQLSSVGGIVSYLKDSTVKNCYYFGNAYGRSITSSAYVGGIVGYAEGYNGGSSITNCLVGSNILSASTDGSPADYARSLTGIAWGSCSKTNCYYNENITIFMDGVISQSRQDGTKCTIEQMNNQSFYSDTLGWDATIWDFSSIDVEERIYPIIVK